MANQVVFQAVYTYDQAFRMLISKNQNMSWSQVNNTLFCMHLGKAVPLAKGVVCFTCNKPGHISSQCTRQSSSVASATSPAFSVGWPFPAPSDLVQEVGRVNGSRQVSRVMLSTVQGSVSGHLATFRTYALDVVGASVVRMP